MDLSAPASLPAALYRHIRAGFDRAGPGFIRTRHAHLSPYVSIIVEGQYQQTSYAGRVRLEPGDILIQPVLDRHESRVLGRREVRFLRLPWFADLGVGGVYRVDDPDVVIRTAVHDVCEAAGLLRELLPNARRRPPAVLDWPDLLAAQLLHGEVRISRWAHGHNLTRETVSRGFHRTYGVAPHAFATELRAREAWIRTITRSDALAIIADELGYSDQAHMTRAVRTLTGAPPGAWRRHLAPMFAAVTKPGARSALR